jgi:alanyl-tRNA synthetase
LGAHVQQKGSLVNAERTRFDFAHNAPLTEAQIRAVEVLVNREILNNTKAQARVMDIEAAQKTGALMLFGEKYGDSVRVLDIGFSRELCGGTHVQRTGDVGVFKIVSESGVAAGVRRVEALTGTHALAYLQQLEGAVNSLAQTLKAPLPELQERLHHLLAQTKQAEKEVQALKTKLAVTQGHELAHQAQSLRTANGQTVRWLAARLDGADAPVLRDILQNLKDKLQSAVVVLAAVAGGKVQIAAGVTPDQTKQIQAGELVNFVAAQVGGKGGGKADVAMGAGSDAARLDQALASVQAWVQAKLA